MANRGKLSTLLDRLGLAAGWKVTDDCNLVASCHGCNSHKSSTVFPDNQLVMLLSNVAEKAPQVALLRHQFEREDKSDRLCAQLEIALARGLLTERDVSLALAKAAGGDDLVQLTTTLEFLDGAPLSIVQPSAVEELLDRPVRLGADLPEGLELTNAADESRNVRTCREYRAALESGFYCATNFAIKVSSAFEVTINLLEALSACRPSAESFIRHPRRGLCDIDLLPSSLLPLLGPSTDKYNLIVSSALTIGGLISQGLAQVRRVSSASIGIEADGAGVYLREMLRADLDGDGCEDLLASSYLYAVGGTLGFEASPIVLARRNFNTDFTKTEVSPSPTNLNDLDS